MPLNYGALGFSDKQNQMFQDAENALDKSDGWYFMEKVDPRSFAMKDKNDGYYNELNRIGSFMKYKHTPESFAETMMEMKKLNDMGIDGYCSLYTVAFPIASAPKHVVERTAEMDAKVIDEINNRPPFKAAPKWSKEYVTAHPAVLSMLPKPGVSDPTARRLNF
jgi:hypothetical protein